MWSCPTFYTATSFLQSIDVGVHTAVPRHLVAHQVGVVRGGDPVVSQGSPHLLSPNPGPVVRRDNLHGVVEHQEVGEPFLTKAQLVLRGLEGLDDLPAFIRSQDLLLFHSHEVLEGCDGQPFLVLSWIKL